MAFVPVPTVAQFALRFTYHGQQVVNTLSFQRNLGWSIPDLNTMCQQLVGWWAAEMAPNISAALVGNSVYGLSLQSDTAPSVVYPWPLDAVAGERPGSALPGNVAFCVSFRTGARGRSGRGRNYLCGLAEADVTLNALSSTVANGMRTAYEALPAVAATNDAIWVVVQRFSNNNPLPAGVPRPVLTVTYTDLTVDTQSGRLR